MYKQLLTIALFAASFAASAQEPKQWVDKTEAAYLVLHTMDWAQTRYAVQRPALYHEKNLILGEHPALGAVNRYFLFAGIAHIAIANILPERYVKPFQYVTIIIEGRSVYRNYTLGLGFAF